MKTIRNRYIISGILLVALMLGATSFSFAQEMNKEEVAQNSGVVETPESAFYKNAVKLNSLALVGIFNPAIEFWVGNKFTLQTELLLSPYLNNCLGTGKPFACALAYFEGRYYPRRAFSGFFIGPVVGGGPYKMNKGIYPMYRRDYNNDSYQQGWNMMLGASIGYMFSLSSRWGLEVNIGCGYQHSWYRGFKRESKSEPYEMYIDWNYDAEFLPFFKGGLLIAYKF